MWQKWKRGVEEKRLNTVEKTSENITLQILCFSTNNHWIVLFHLHSHRNLPPPLDFPHCHATASWSLSPVARAPLATPAVVSDWTLSHWGWDYALDCSHYCHCTYGCHKKLSPRYGNYNILYYVYYIIFQKYVVSPGPTVDRGQAGIELFMGVCAL